MLSNDLRLMKMAALDWHGITKANDQSNKRVNLCDILAIEQNIARITMLEYPKKEVLLPFGRRN